MKRLIPLACTYLLAGLVAGCGGDKLSSSISAVIPDSVFLARTVDVTISGFDTNWSSSTTVSFGDGIKVDSLTVASPTALVATIEVAPDAAAGPRDVTVTDGGATSTYKGAFKLIPPAELTVEGELAQGAPVVLKWINKDFDNPFDTTSTGDGLFTPIVYTNIAIAGASGVQINVNNVTPYEIDAIALIDVTAAPGALSLDVTSGPADGTTVKFPSAPQMLMARMPQPLTPGTTAMGPIAKPYDSALLQLMAPQGVQIIDAVTSTPDGNSNAQPAFVVLPKSGLYNDLYAYAAAATLVSVGDPYYFIFWDSTGTAGYTYNVDAKATTANTGSDSEPNDGMTKAQAVSKLPFVVQEGKLDSLADEDWFAVTVDATAMNKTFHVQTVPGDPFCDTLVDVLDSDGMTSLGGPSDDADYHEDFTSSPITHAGTFYVKVSTGSGFDSSQPNYVAIIRLQ